MYNVIFLLFLYGLVVLYFVYIWRIEACEMGRIMYFTVCSTVITTLCSPEIGEH
jgi:hypothetical protein